MTLTARYENNIEELCLCALRRIKLGRPYGFGSALNLFWNADLQMIAGRRPWLLMRRRTRRRGRPRVLISVRTATRNFDLQLAIATLQLPAPALFRLERIRTLPVVYGGNRADFFVALAPVR